MYRCTGCDKTDSLWSVCMDCVKRRHRTVLNRGRCTCRTTKYLGEVKAPHGERGRKFRGCQRCLGQVQVN